MTAPACERAGAKIVVFGITAVAVEDEMAGNRYVHGEVSRALVGGTAVVEEGVDADRALGDFAGNAGVDDVDDPADRGRAEQ